MADSRDMRKKDDEDPAEAPQAPAVIAALNSPIRRKIMRRLADGADARSPNELSAEIGGRLSTISYHVRVLAKKGVIRLVDERPVRGAREHFYVSLVNGDEQIRSFLLATKPYDERAGGKP